MSVSRSNATNPETIGVAILVPSLSVQPWALLSPKKLLWPSAARIPLPGATTEGFSSSHLSLSPSSSLGP